MMDNTKNAVKRQVIPFWLIVAMVLIGLIELGFMAENDGCAPADPKCSQGVR